MAELREIAKEIALIQLLNLPALEAIRRLDRETTFFYADPPYTHGARAAGSRASYAHEMSDEDHAALCDALNGIKGRAAISGYENPIYAARLCGWNRYEYATQTGDFSGSARTSRTEVVWLNYDPNEGQGALAL